MKVTVEFHGILSEWVGTPTASFDLAAGATFSDLMAEISRRYRRNMPDPLWNKENNTFKKVRAHGRERIITSADTPLLEGEKIQFLLMIAGG